ncbi:hypothetical protein [Thermopolyspora flexuosa]|jgi:hypothetical protein|uniref:Uncharacterized protein n=1 Tax=Thermopolyspora flexuosa TaxID=103836 RepID=A0A543IXH0_9ACTN|nr:hypothetical protein [Thermopolyspora flexuosa]TQM75270.1 hypothetical protein FHX40_1975 [Thermopolyspora flexuosa]
MIASGGDGAGPAQVPRLSQATPDRHQAGPPGGGRPGGGTGGSAAAPVEAALAPLRRLESLPVREHVAVYEQVLADLEATLATVAADPAAPGGGRDDRAGEPDGVARP